MKTLKKMRDVSRQGVTDVLDYVDRNFTPIICIGIFTAVINIGFHIAFSMGESSQAAAIKAYCEANPDVSIQSLLECEKYL